MVAATLILGSCFLPFGSSSSKKDDKPQGKDLLAAYGIKTDLGAPTGKDGQTLPADYNPFGSKLQVLAATKQLFVTGAPWDGGGSFNAQGAYIVDSSSNNAYSPIAADNDNSWINNPHASVGADTLGTGIQKVVSAVFYPTTSIDTKSTATGSLYLMLISGVGNPYSRKAVRIPGDYSISIASDKDERSYKVHIAAADIDGDGRDELGVVVGNKVVFLDDETTNFALLNQRDFSTSQDTQQIHMVTICAADLAGDGKKQFVVTDGTYKVPGAQYFVFGGSSASEFASGAIRHPTLGTYQIANVAAGDLDGDKKDDLVFAGRIADDNDDTDYYTISTASWDIKTNRLIFKKAFDRSNDFNIYTHFLIPVVCFNPEGAMVSAKDKVFVLEKVLSYDAATDQFSTYAGTSDVDVAYYDQAIAADVNQDGKEELVMLPKNSKVIQISGCDSSGNFRKLAEAGTGTRGDYTSLAAVDIRGNSAVLEFKNRELKFTKPTVLAVLASPPYYTNAVDPGNLSNYGTSFGTSSSSTSGSFSVNASFSVGMSVQSPLEGSAFSSETIIYS